MTKAAFERHWSNVIVIVVLTVLGFLAQDKLRSMTEQNISCINISNRNQEKIHRIENRVIILETEIPHVAKSLDDMNKEVKRIRVIIENSSKKGISK